MDTFLDMESRPSFSGLTNFFSFDFLAAIFSSNCVTWAKLFAPTDASKAENSQKMVLRRHYVKFSLFLLNNTIETMIFRVGIERAHCLMNNELQSLSHQKFFCGPKNFSITKCVKIFDFFQNISIRFKTFRFVSKHFDYFKKFRLFSKISILFKNFDSFQNISIRFKIFDSFQKFRLFSKISIRFKNFDSYQKFWFVSKISIFFSKISIRFKNFDSFQKFRFFSKISILFKFL